MTTKRIVALVLATNLLCLAVLGAIVLSTPKAQAAAPATASLVGPYYITFGGADFHSYRDDFAITHNDGYGMVRNVNGLGIGMTGLHLPSGAVLAQVLNDSEKNSGAADKLWVFQCPLGSTSCSSLGSATQNLTGRHQVSGSLGSATIDNLNNDYFLQIDLPDDSVFYYARIEYSLPAPVYLPAIMR